MAFYVKCLIHKVITSSWNLFRRTELFGCLQKSLAHSPLSFYLFQSQIVWCRDCIFTHMIRFSIKWNFNGKWKEERRNGRGEREEGMKEERIKSTKSCSISILKYKTRKFFFLDVHSFCSNRASHMINSYFNHLFLDAYFVFSDHFCLLLIHFSFATSPIAFPIAFPSEVRSEFHDFHHL